MKLEEILSNTTPLLYHCSDLRKAKFEDRDTDILRDGIIPLSMYDEFDAEIDGGGYGGSYAPNDADMPDHICVWVQDEKTPMRMKETLNRMRDEQITFILSPETEWKLVNNHTEVEHYHESEGLVKGPVEINDQNIEAVVIAKEKILENYSGEDAIPPQEFWNKHLQTIKKELEERDIPVYLTQTLPDS